MRIDWNVFGSLGTTCAVLVAAWQVRRGRQQATTDFEDDLSREYRELARAIPVDVHLGRSPEETIFSEILPRLYQYIDLSNEQVFLRMSGRVSRATWRQWCDGIQATLALPAFARAWGHFKNEAPGRFSELRRLEATGYGEDPRGWMHWWQRLRQSFSA